jgi:tetratricopeptide (TPR) repeat protein
MKFIALLFSLIAFSAHAAPEGLTFQDLNQEIMAEGMTVSRELKKAKFFLINGETRRARAILTHIAHTQSKLRPIVYRYLGIMYFMEGNFRRSLHFLSLPEVSSLPHYAKICTLKVITQIALSKNSELDEEWKRCKLEAISRMDQARLPWLDTLVELKLNPADVKAVVPLKTLRIASLENEDLKVLLKLGLYLNKQDYIIYQVENLTLEQLQDPEVRDLIAQIYFRNGQLAKSYKFVGDLRSPNSENIKGNLYLLRTKYELAYAQFKLALEQKQNSQNALERLIPLAWLLGDWENGVKYAEKIIASPTTQTSKLTLVSAFHVEKGEYAKARNVLQQINQTSKRGSEKDVTQLSTFVGLMENDAALARKNAEASCRNYDMLNCWVAFQLTQWEAFPLTMRRKEPIVAKNDWEKLTSEELTEPLTEVAYVNQTDIEELDDQLIQLIPKADSPSRTQQ